MKLAWAIILISAFTDVIVTGGTALMSSMAEGKTGEMPGWPAITVALIGGIVAGARTIQQHLKGMVNGKGTPPTP